MVRNYVPKPRQKTMPCRHCNKPIIVGWQQKKLPVHPECSIAAAADAARQMHDKRGPLYDRWLLAMTNAILRESTTTLGVSETIPPL